MHPACVRAVIKQARLCVSGQTCWRPLRPWPADTDLTQRVECTDSKNKPRKQTRTGAHCVHARQVLGLNHIHLQRALVPVREVGAARGSVRAGQVVAMRCGGGGVAAH